MADVENINTSWLVAVYITWGSIIHCNVIIRCCSSINISCLNLNGAEFVIHFQKSTDISEMMLQGTKPIRTCGSIGIYDNIIN